MSTQNTEGYHVHLERLASTPEVKQRELALQTQNIFKTDWCKQRNVFVLLHSMPRKPEADHI
jgi:hypothetical protein